MEEPFTIAEAKFTIAELKVLSLKPGDVLTVKLVDHTDLEIFTQQDMGFLREKLKKVFPENEVMVFAMPKDTDIIFEAVSPELKLDEPENCSTAPKGYCEGCNCGKKEAAEKTN